MPSATGHAAGGAESEDAALVRGMAAGGDRALGALDDQWHAVVHGVVARVLRQPDDIEDVVEETFWQAWRQASRFDPARGAVQTWLLTIARSRALDRVRALRRRRESPLEGDDGEAVGQQAAPGDPGLAAEASEREPVLAHVAGCAECQRELAALENTAGELALATSPQPMAPAQRDRIKARLLARAAADRASERAFTDPLNAETLPWRVESSLTTQPSEVIPFRPTRRGMGAAAWMAMAAGLVAIVGMGAFMRASRERDAMRAALQVAQAERGARIVALDSMRATLEDKDRM